jgi:glycosyltransferase involved in cell wall biosynthesis
MCSSGKALIITPFFKPNVGGAETFAEDLAKELSKKYIVHVCTIKWTKPFLFEGTSAFKALSLLFKLNIAYRKMRKNKYEKVYALGLIACFLCCFYRIRFHAIMLTLISYGKFSKLLKSILNNSEKVFIEGKTGKQDLIKKGIQENKIVTFEHWADRSRFYPVEHTNRRLKVLFIGRPIKAKGRHIIEQCEKMTKGIDYEYIENVPYKNLPKHYQMADIVVIPSVYYESFSRIVVEAALCGCIVITSDMGSLPEQVKGFGFSVPPSAIYFKKLIEAFDLNRDALALKRLETILYANKNFTEKNAEVFLK